MKFSKELVGATSQMLVLGVLESGDFHGYEIVRRISERSNDVFDWKESTIYPVLHKLEKAELIESYWETGETGKRRRVYTMTRAGKRHLKSQKKEWNTYAGTVNQILEVRFA